MDPTSNLNSDRWDAIKPTTWEFMPFGGGPHACVGQHKALVEASYILAKFAQLYKGIESRDAKEWAGQRRLMGVRLCAYLRDWKGIIWISLSAAHGNPVSSFIRSPLSLEYIQTFTGGCVLGFAVLGQ